MYEVRLRRPDGKIIVLKYSSAKEAEEAFEFAAKYEFEIVTNPMCDGCSLKGKGCIGERNHVWTGCVYRKEDIA